MIIDVHSHAWRFPEDFSEDFIHQAQRARAGQPVNLTVRYADYADSASGVARTIAFGGKARLSGVWVDDEYVAAYVAKHPDKLIGFLSVDPTQHGWEREMQVGHEELGLRGIKLLPMYAGFSPDDEKLEPLWQYAGCHGLPVLLHMGTTFIAQAPLNCTLPRLIEPVALRHPEVKIILAHLGHPYEGDQRAPLPALAVLQQPHARTGIRCLAQAVVRHRLPVYHRGSVRGRHSRTQ